MKNLKIKSFGMLTEKLSATEFEFPYHKDTEDLLKALKSEYPQLKNLNFSLAVNKELTQENTALDGSEEIALLPPFSGG